MTSSWVAGQHVSEDATGYEATQSRFAEAELVSLWLLGRVPGELLPWRLMRAGRAGRGPGPDVREATFQHENGVPLTGDIELHLRASDFVRHGHATDPAYDGVILHLVWEDDRGRAAGTPTRLPGGELVPTIAVGPALNDNPRLLRKLVRLGPTGTEPCAASAAGRDADAMNQIIRFEGRRRAAERAWRAARLVELRGWDGAWNELLVRSLRSSSGRRTESDEERELLALEVTASLGMSLQSGLRNAATEGRPGVLIEQLRQSGRPGRARATEIGWNAALPLLAAGAAAYGDRELAVAVALLVERWPAARPYGRTETLRSLVTRDGEPASRGGALYAQGLLHLQDLWCERGGCGVCPLSAQPGVVGERREN
jgi:Protein of unknown function (DUF2851)